MELEEVEIYLDPDGKVTIQPRGVRGPKCLEATGRLEAALGNVVLEHRTTAEFDENPEYDALRSLESL